MTLLPDVAGPVKDRPDLPDYYLGWRCMVEGCLEKREDGGGHHVFRRSHGTRSWWVELEDGTLVPNRVGLCQDHHKAVTGDVGGHRARVEIDGDRLLWTVIFRDVELTKVSLVFEMDPFAVLELQEKGYHDIDVNEPGHIWSLPERIEVPGDDIPRWLEPAPEHTHAEVEPGTKCPTCHRRVNHKKKDSSPVSKIFSFRFPQEGAEEYEQTMEAVAQHWGLDTKKKYWKGELFLELMVEALQRPKKQVRANKDGRGE